MKRPTIISDIYEILNITCKCPYYENGQFQFAQHLLESKIGTLEINNCTCGNPHNIFENKNAVAMIVLFIAVYTNDNDTKKKYTVLTLDNYKPGNCNKNMTPSKGGYKREQLYDFGVNVLKIPHTKLRKDNKLDGGKLSKDELCIIVNNKYREIQKYGSNMDDIRLTAYEKDINNCNKGKLPFSAALTNGVLEPLSKLTSSWF